MEEKLSAKQKELRQLQDTLESKEDEIRRLQKQLKASQTELDELREGLSAEKQVESELSTQIRLLKSELVDMAAEKQLLEERLASVEVEHHEEMTAQSDRFTAGKLQQIQAIREVNRFAAAIKSAGILKNQSAIAVMAAFYHWQNMLDEMRLMVGAEQLREMTFDVNEEAELNDDFDVTELDIAAIANSFGL